MQSLLRTTFATFLRSPQRHTAYAQGHCMTSQRNKSSGAFKKMKNIDNLVIKKGAKLPYKTELEGIGEICIEYITQENGEEAWKLLRSCIDLGLGYSAEELEPLDEFLHNAQRGRDYFQVVDQNKNKTIVVFAGRRCPVSRSERTVHYSWLTTMSPDLRNKGFGQSYFAMLSVDLGRCILGHPGFPVGRSTLGRGVHMMQHAGFLFTGTIPN